MSLWRFAWRVRTFLTGELPKIRELTVVICEHSVRTRLNDDGSTERWVTKQVSYHRAEKGEQLPHLGDLEPPQAAGNARVGNGVLTHRLRDHLRGWP